MKVTRHLDIPALYNQGMQQAKAAILASGLLVEKTLTLTFTTKQPKVSPYDARMVNGLVSHLWMVIVSYPDPHRSCGWRCNPSAAVMWIWVRD